MQRIVSRFMGSRANSAGKDNEVSLAADEPVPSSAAEQDHALHSAVTRENSAKRLRNLVPFLGKWKIKGNKFASADDALAAGKQAVDSVSQKGAESVVAASTDVAEPVHLEDAERSPLSISKDNDMEDSEPVNASNVLTELENVKSSLSKGITPVDVYDKVFPGGMNKGEFETLTPEAKSPNLRDTETFGRKRSSSEDFKHTSMILRDWVSLLPSPHPGATSVQKELRVETEPAILGAGSMKKDDEARLTEVLEQKRPVEDVADMALEKSDNLMEELLCESTESPIMESVSDEVPLIVSGVASNVQPKSVVETEPATTGDGSDNAVMDRSLFEAGEQKVFVEDIVGTAEPGDGVAEQMQGEWTGEIQDGGYQENLNYVQMSRVAPELTNELPGGLDEDTQISVDRSNETGTCKPAEETHGEVEQATGERDDQVDETQIRHDPFGAASASNVIEESAGDVNVPVTVAHDVEAFSVPLSESDVGVTGTLLDVEDETPFVKYEAPSFLEKVLAAVRTDPAVLPPPVMEDSTHVLEEGLTAEASLGEADITEDLREQPTEKLLNFFRMKESEGMQRGEMLRLRDAYLAAGREKSFKDLLSASCVEGEQNDHTQACDCEACQTLDRFRELERLELEAREQGRQRDKFLMERRAARATKTKPDMFITSL